MNASPSHSIATLTFQPRPHTHDQIELLLDGAETGRNLLIRVQDIETQYYRSSDAESGVDPDREASASRRRKLAVLAQDRHSGRYAGISCEEVEGGL